MNTKLTLTIEQSVIEKAKRYARKRDRSLSDLIQNYLKALTSTESENGENIPTSSIIQSMKGSFKMPKDFDYKKELTDKLSDKYL